LKKKKKERDKKERDKEKLECLTVGGLHIMSLLFLIVDLLTNIFYIDFLTLSIILFFYILDLINGERNLVIITKRENTVIYIIYINYKIKKYMIDNSFKITLKN